MVRRQRLRLLRLQGENASGLPAARRRSTGTAKRAGCHISCVRKRATGTDSRAWIDKCQVTCWH